jgi:hypothetical protein
MTVVEYINKLATEIRENDVISIEGAVYCVEDFPPGFWRKLAKDVNYLHAIENIEEVLDRRVASD